MRKFLIFVVAALGIAVALDHPDTAKEKVGAGGDIVSALTGEAGNVVNEGLGQVQNFGNAPAEAPPETAPPVGDGRP